MDLNHRSLLGSLERETGVCGEWAWVEVKGREEQVHPSPTCTIAGKEETENHYRELENLDLDHSNTDLRSSTSHSSSLSLVDEPHKTDGEAEVWHIRVFLKLVG